MEPPSSSSSVPESTESSGESSGREWLRIFVPMLLLAVVAFGIAWHFVKPAPPSHVVIATGSKSGMYYATAQKYVQYFGDNGITLEVRETGGSVDNFKLLSQADSDVDLAIVQAGSSAPEQRQHIHAVAGIYFEPVMVFYRGDVPITQLSQLAGKKIAIGSEGSGVRVMATMLLDEAGVSPKSDGSTFMDLGSDKAAEAVSSGAIDAAFYVIAPDAAVVTKLLAAPGVHLMSFDHAHAYGRRHPFLSPTTLYQGSIDIQHNIPAKDVQLIAAPATLVARDTTHQAIIQLLVRAAQENNAGTTLLSDAGTFPNADGSELTVSHDAKFFLKNPPSILHRTLPFWLASMVDRLIIMILPLLVVLIPLVRMAPPLLKWRTQRKLLARYKRTRQIEERLNPQSPSAMLQAGLDELQTMDNDLATMKLPISFAQDLYNLRVNISYVRSRLRGWLQPGAATAGEIH